MGSVRASSPAHAAFARALRGVHPAGALATRIFALTLALELPAAPAQAQPWLGVAVKATYLYKFAPFVTWPPTAQPNAAFVICVIGADPFGPTLDQAIAGQGVDGRPFAIRRLAVASHEVPCQIAYLGGAPSQSVIDAEQVLHGAPVLTVTDGNSEPGIIDFVIDQGHVRFRIDDAQAAQSGLKISSKLLSLAVSVIPRTAPGASR